LMGWEFSSFHDLLNIIQLRPFGFLSLLLTRTGSVFPSSNRSLNESQAVKCQDQR